MASSTFHIPGITYAVPQPHQGHLPTPDGVSNGITGRYSHSQKSASPALASNQFNSAGHGAGGSPSPAPSSHTMQNTSQVPPAPQPLPAGVKQPPVPVPTHNLQSISNSAANGTSQGQPAVASDFPLPKPMTSSPVVKTLNMDGAQTQKFADDYARLCDVIKTCGGDVVRRAVRDNFHKCVLGSSFHMAFLLNIVIHRADKDTLQRAVHDFGDRLVHEATNELVDSLTTADLDNVADKILAKASTTFLDKALVTRLPTIEARRLVNALARAGRLGYDADDIVENEHVIPSMRNNGTAAPRPPAATASSVTPSAFRDIAYPGYVPSSQIASASNNAVAGPTGPSGSSKPQCSHCNRIFSAASALNYHLKKNVCQKSGKAPPSACQCPHCGTEFGGTAGLKYHLTNKVCGDFGPVAAGVNGSDLCPHCGLEFTGPGNMQRHLMNCGHGLEHPNPPFDLNPPTKRPAPDSNPLYVSSGSNSPAPPRTTLTGSQTPQSVTPNTRLGSAQDTPLGTPHAKDMSHLTANQISALVTELRQAEEQFKNKIDDVQKTVADPDAMEKRLTSLRNSYACKQSTVRKKYGIKLRHRRGQAEMDVERARMGYGMAAFSSSGHATTGNNDQHTDKRVRRNEAGDFADTQTQQDDTPTKQVAVSDMSNGLNGSNATAATEDPTTGTPQASQPSQGGAAARPSSSSSYQQGSYRVEVHVPSPSRKPTSSAPSASSPPRPVPGPNLRAEDLLRQIGGVTMISDDDTDSDSDSSTDDGDGPA